MSDMWVYVIVAWIVVLGGLGVYAWTIVSRGRRLSRIVPPEDRRWS
ncbi:MAG: hypothetical protein MUE36_01935 [Acidimicrobiales bacterium]|jgi:hypothetical protein|nr:hypothetical protein [Acidimicrobiales bacterium]